IWGYGGVLTFGHAVFFGLGGYVMAALLQSSLPSAVGVLGFPLAAVVAGVAAFALAAPLFSREITGEYFAIITLVLAVIAKQAAISLGGITGGYSGITGLPAVDVGGLRLLGPAMYYLVIATTVACYFLSRRVVGGTFGTAAIAIRENEAKARALGYDTTRYKTLLFAITGALAGLSGAFFTTYSGFVTPELLGFILSTEVLIWVLVGGRGTIVGAVVGTVFLTLFKNFMSDLFSSWILLLGVVLVVIVVAFPGGFVGVARDLLSEGRGE
ncbi:MAG: branched-chain amino acid ABC transporter permease, partial [Salinigranum sp.]